MFMYRIIIGNSAIYEEKNKKEVSKMGERGRVYNRIFNQDDWDLVLDKNKELLDDYLDEYRARKKKQSTINQYKNDGRIVMIYILKNLKNKAITELRKKDFRKFTLWMSEDCGMSNSRVNRLMSFTRSFLDYLEDDDDTDYENNTAKKVKGLPKEEVRKINFISDEDVHMLSEKLIELKEYQLNALLWVAYDTGCRKNELHQLKKPQEVDQRVLNEVVAKRGKIYKPILMSKGREAVTLYLDQRGEDDNDDLWITNGASKLSITPNALYDRFVKMGRILSEIKGETILLSTHDFRHSLIQNLNDGTHYFCKDKGKIALEDVQKIVRHSSVSTTQSYLQDRTDEEVADLLLG